jgi:pilus assembly protein CpaE
LYAFNVGCVIGTSELLGAVQNVLRDFNAQIVIDERDIPSREVFQHKIEQTLPDVMLLDAAQGIRDFEEIIRLVKASSAQPKVIVLNTSADPAMIMRYVRAGADEYLYPPIETDLKAALERMSAERMKQKAALQKRGKVLGFVSAKGGCGATTAACHIAVEMHKLTNSEILIADFDFEGGMVGFLMGSKQRYSIIDAAENTHRLDASFWKALTSNGHRGVEVVVSPAQGTPMAKLYRNPEDYRKVVRFTRSVYEWTIVDMGSGFGYPMQSLLEELDELYIYTTTEVPALHQAKTLCAAIKEKGYPPHRMHVVVNRLPKRSELTLDELDQLLGHRVYGTIPNDYHVINEAYSEGLLVAGGSKLVQHFDRLAAKIAGVERGTKEKRRFSLF